MTTATRGPNIGARERKGGGYTLAVGGTPVAPPAWAPPVPATSAEMAWLREHARKAPERAQMTMQDQEWVRELTEVAPDRAGVARRVVPRIVDDLKLRDGVTVRWFWPEAAALEDARLSGEPVAGVRLKVGRQWRGVVFGDAPTSIWIRARLTGAALAWALGHECTHVQQLAQFGATAVDANRPLMERQANAYAEEVTTWYRHPTR